METNDTTLSERMEQLVSDYPKVTIEEAYQTVRPWHVLDKLVKIREEGLISKDAPIGRLVVSMLSFSRRS
ncbi:MAG: hypothetical protein Q8L51_03110 [Candidatus Amesbacteria bacterium]|nr:hypothetical protein [Candidatus Amesbacteria bacterium]